MKKLSITRPAGFCSLITSHWVLFNKEFTMRALCIFRGMLVVAEVTKSKKDRCPECFFPTFFVKYNGWLKCIECGFSILETDYKKLNVK